jgi:3-phenylpropionate/trans-cinnamate dioxygenase ferredoxin reductase subunit
MVIIGAGHAGGRAAEAMRQAGFTGEIVLLGEEAHVPHERPPLSKELLTGEEGAETTFLNPPAYYAENKIDLRLGTRAEAIDRDGQAVVLADGGRVGYDKLLIATGARVRRIDCPGADLAGIHYIRTIDDTLALRPELKEGVRVAVIGGGFIGLEVAAGARVVELADQVLSRVADPAVGDLVAGLHKANNVHIVTGSSVERFEGNGRVAELVCTDGETIAAELVVVAYHFNPILGRHLRLESWANAQNGGIAVARNMVTEPTPYVELPWFWSDQFDLNLQVVGAPLSWERLVTRGDPASGRCVVFYMDGSRVVGATAFNQGREIRACRQLVESGKAVSDEELADPATRLRDLARA